MRSFTNFRANFKHLIERLRRTCPASRQPATTLLKTFPTYGRDAGLLQVRSGTRCKRVFTATALGRCPSGFVPLRAPAARQGYCPPFHFARSLHDRATVLHVVAAIARTTSSLHSVPLRPPPSRRAGCTPFHCAGIVELTCGAKRRAPCGSMVFHQTCLQTPCPRPDSYLRSRGLLDGSLVKNHVVLRTAEHRAAHKGHPGCARSKIGAQTAHRAAFMVCRLCIGKACPTSAQVDALPPLFRGDPRTAGALSF